MALTGMQLMKFLQWALFLLLTSWWLNTPKGTEYMPLNQLLPPLCLFKLQLGQAKHLQLAVHLL